MTLYKCFSRCNFREYYVPKQVGLFTKGSLQNNAYTSDFTNMAGAPNSNVTST